MRWRSTNYPRRVIAFTGFLVLGLASIHGNETAPALDPQSPILKAAQAGDVAAVTRMIDEGVSVNSCSARGDTILRTALQAGKFDVAEAVINRGFDPTLIYRSAITGDFVEIGLGALSFAARQDRADIVDQLLARGLRAYPRHFSAEFGLDDPVREAIKGDHRAILRRLLDSAEPGLVQKKMARLSYTYLTDCRSLEAVRILVDHGADANAWDQNIPCPRVLHTLAQRGWSEGVSLLLQLDADATQEDHAHRLPEECAATPDLKHLLQLAVIRTRCHLSLPSQTMESAADDRFPLPLFEAAFQVSEDAAIQLVAGLSPRQLSATDDRGWTAANYALKDGFPHLARALIEHGADASHVTTGGSALIAFAAAAGAQDIVRQLAARGADVNLADNGKSTALEIATQGHDLPMIELLLSLGAKVEPPHPCDARQRWVSAFMVAAKTGDLALMERMRQAGGDVTSVDSSGENIVFWAVRSGRTEAVRWALDHGAYLQLKTPRGTNALTLAASLGDLPMVKYLVGLGLTHPEALHFAETSWDHYDQATVDFLQALQARTAKPDPGELWQHFTISTDEVHRYLANGGDVNYGETCPTPLQAMAMQHNAEAVALLLDRGADPLKRGRLANSAVFLSFGGFANYDPGYDAQALAVLRVFIEHGISPDRQEFVYGMEPPERIPTGETLLARAVELGFVQCAKYLLAQGANPAVRSQTWGIDAFDRLRDCTSITEEERFELHTLMMDRLNALAPMTDPPLSPPKISGPNF